MSSLNNEFGFQPLETELQNEFGFQPEEQPKNEESTDWARHLARSGSRIAETIVGLPGDLISFIKGISEKLPNPPEILQREPNFIQKLGKNVLESLPTSASLKKKSEELTSEYTKPKSESEEISDEIVSLSTALAFPSKDPLKFKSLLSAIGKATGVKTAGKTAEYLGASEEGKAFTELGGLFLTGLMGKKTAPKFVNEQFQEARSSIPKGTLLPTHNLNSGLTAVEQELNRGIKTATKSEVLNSVKDLKKKSSGGFMEADELVEAYHNLNEKISSKKLFEDLSKGERALLKRRYDMIKNPLSETIKDYGKYNPKFYNKWNNANQSYATIAKSKQLSNWIESKIGSIPKHLAGGIALEVLTGHPKLAVATAGSAASLKIGEMIYRIMKSPSLRKHYIDVIAKGSEENFPAFVKSLSKLEEGLTSKEELDRQKD